MSCSSSPLQMIGLGRRDTSGARKEALRWMRVRTKDITPFQRLHCRDSANLCAFIH